MSSKLPGSRELMGLGLSDFRRHWKLYMGILLTVGLPTNIITTYFAPSTGLQSFLSMANLFMNVALLYAIIRLSRDDRPFDIRTAYYSGSHAVLRFLIVAVWLLLMLIPLAIGSDIYVVSVAGAITPGVGEQILLGLIGLIFAVPTFWLITRFGLGLVAVVDHEVRPIMALRLAWRITAGRFWPVLGRLVMASIWIILLLVLPMALWLVLYSVLKWLFWLMLVQLTVALVALPVYVLYSFYLYQALGGPKVWRRPAE